MFEFLLLDMDDTILDFHKAEYFAIRKTLSAFGIEPTDETCDLYSRINLSFWKALERKEVSRQELEWGRFDQLFRQLDVQADPVACGELYYENLSEGHYFLDGAKEALESLAKQYKVYLVTNGTSQVQARRIADAGLAPIVRGIFISQEMGADKPDPVFFHNAFDRIPDFNPTKALIVGDSLSSDIQGGKNMGIATCWINPRGQTCPPKLTPDYQIASLTQLEDILKNSGV